MMVGSGAAAPCGDRASSWLGLPHTAHCAALLFAVLMVLAVPRTGALAAVPEGVWLIDGRAAVQIFDCSGQLCGRILWEGSAQSTGTAESRQEQP
jgi:hypothetical protein